MDGGGRGKEPEHTSSSLTSTKGTQQLMEVDSHGNK